MTRWIVENPAEGETKWSVVPVSMALGYPRVVAEFPATKLGQWDAEALAATLNAEYVAGMRDAQEAARQAFAMALGTDESVFEMPKESNDGTR